MMTLAETSRRSRRRTSITALLGVAALLLAGCGSSNHASTSASSTGAAAAATGKPGGNVATIASTPITRAAFDHWYTAAIRDAVARGQGVTTDPPKYAGCVVALRKAIAPQAKAKHRPVPSRRQLLGACKREQAAYTASAMGILINGGWIDAAAKEAGVSVTDAAVSRQLAQTNKTTFQGNAQALQQYLTTTGLVTADLRDQARQQLLLAKLQQRARNSAPPVTQSEMRAYYRKHLAQLAIPERRRVNLVMTKTLAKAQAARAALQHGGSWKKVADAYSIDDATKQAGGVVPALNKGAGDPAMSKAAFANPVGKLLGPIKGSFSFSGWFVIQVAAITSGRNSSLASVSTTVRGTLLAQHQQRALEAFAKSFGKTWKSRTHCAPGFVVANCANAPAPRHRAVKH
jgi:foldase protein PrsA